MLPYHDAWPRAAGRCDTAGLSLQGQAVEVLPGGAAAPGQTCAQDVCLQDAILHARGTMHFK